MSGLPELTPKLLATVYEAGAQHFAELIEETETAIIRHLQFGTEPLETALRQKSRTDEINRLRELLTGYRESLVAMRGYRDAVVAAIDFGREIQPRKVDLRVWRDPGDVWSARAADSASVCASVLGYGVTMESAIADWLQRAREARHYVVIDTVASEEKH